MLHTNYKQIIIGAYAYARTFQIRKKTSPNKNSVALKLFTKQIERHTYKKKVRTTKITMKYATFSVLD